MSGYVRKRSRRNTSSPYRVPTFTPTCDIITCHQVGWGDQKNATSHRGTNINQAVLANWRKSPARRVTLAASLQNVGKFHCAWFKTSSKIEWRLCCRLTHPWRQEGKTTEVPQFSVFLNRDSPGREANDWRWRHRYQCTWASTRTWSVILAKWEANPARP